MDSAQRRPGERRAEPVAEKPVQRTRAQRPQPDATELEIRPSQGERRRTLARDALGDEQSDRFRRPACARRTPARAPSTDPATARRPPPRARVPLRPAAEGRPDTPSRSSADPAAAPPPPTTGAPPRARAAGPRAPCRAPRRAPVPADRRAPRTRGEPRSPPGGRRARALPAREPVPPRSATPSSCRFPPRPRARAPRESRRRQRRRRRQAPRPCRRPRGE